MPYKSLAAEIIDLWRAAERSLATLDPETPEAERMRAEIERLRQEYHRLLDEATRNLQHDLPPLSHSEDPAPS